MRQTEEYSALFVYPANLLIDIRGITTLELPQKLTKDVLAGIHYALSTLEEREQSVLQGVYEESLSLVDIGEQMGLSNERVRQIKVKALRKLREPCRWNYIFHGIAGYCKARATAEYNKGYSKGYTDGYRHGRFDQENNIKHSYGPDDLLAQPVEYLLKSHFHFHIVGFHNQFLLFVFVVNGCRKQKSRLIFIQKTNRLNLLPIFN